MGGPNSGFHVGDSYQEVALLADRMIFLSRHNAHPVAVHVLSAAKCSLITTGECALSRFNASTPFPQFRRFAREKRACTLVTFVHAPIAVNVGNSEELWWFVTPPLEHQAKGNRQDSHARFKRISRPYILSSPNHRRPQRCGIAGECDRQSMYPINSVLAYGGFMCRLSLST